MGVKLTKSGDGTIPASEMKDGDLAIITMWGIQDHVGTVVQRYNKHLLSVGKGFGNSWEDWFNGASAGDRPNQRVRILEPGETLTVE